MNLTPEKRKLLARWVIGIAAVCILIFLGVQNIGVVADAFSRVISLISPLLLGFAFAMILNVPLRFFEARIWSKTKKPLLKKLRRPVSFIIALLIIFGILVGIVSLVIPELVNAVKIIVQGVTDFAVRLGSMNEAELAELPFGKALLKIDWDKLLETLQTWLKNQSGAIMNTAFGTISSLVGGVYNFFIAFIFSVYILFSKEKLTAQLTRLIRAWLPKKVGECSIHIANVANVNFRNFIAGQSLEALILGVLCMVGMLILRIPYAPMVGALVGVTALIPVVGAFIGTIVGAFVILTVDPVKAVIFVIFLLILQQIEGNLIYPKVMGSRVNLPAIWVLAAVTVGGGIAGPIGMLLSVPITSTLYILIREATQSRENKLAANAAESENKAQNTEEEN